MHFVELTEERNRRDEEGQELDGRYVNLDQVIKIDFYDFSEFDERRLEILYVDRTTATIYGKDVDRLLQAQEAVSS